MWKDFFDILNDSAYDDFERIRRWGVAEQAATNFGMEEAARRGLSPNGYEWIFLQTGNIYRGAASAFEGGLGTPLSWLGAGLGVLSGSGEAVTSLDMTPVYTYGELGVSAGFSLGSFFNDPRSLWNGHSPVYWYSTLIWANQETHRWP
ncbi:MAG: hypothetical protein D6816_07235 [Bacteroidetes bacterium]|nr:MAG: hypothetical protein D6816_07235 [Bacteroidota bacterium]